MSQSRLERIVTKIVPEPVHNLVYGNTIRMPRYWRQQKKVCVKTFDSELEELVEELDAIDDACHEMLQIHKVHCGIAGELIASSQRVVNSFHILTHSGVNNATNEKDAAKTSWEIAQSYQIALEETNMDLREIIVPTSHEIGAKISQLLELLVQVHKQVNRRDALLAHYEALLDKYDAMTIQLATKTLSPRQKLEYAGLERAVDSAKADYTACNAMICLELPYFFMLVRQFMEPVLELLYFVHLTLAYQTLLNFAPLASDMNIDKELYLASFLAGLAAEFRMPDSQVLDNLKIVRSHKEYLEQLVRSAADAASTREDEFCRALYDFHSEVAEDLEFRLGNIIRVLGKSGNWWEGEVEGRTGIFPCNYVQSCAVPERAGHALSPAPARNSAPVRNSAPAFAAVHTQDVPEAAQKEKVLA